MLQRINKSTSSYLENKMLVALSIFVLSILVAVSFRFLLPDSLKWSETSDYQNYYEPVARNIVAGKGIVTNDGRLATGQAIGFPLILSILFKFSAVTHISEQLILNAFIFLCYGLTASISFLIFAKVWKPINALIATLIWITYPLFLWFIQSPTSETPYMVAFYGGILALYILLNNPSHLTRNAFLCGLCFGASALLRPISLGMCLIVSLALIFFLREISVILRVKLLTIFLIGFVLPFGWWIGVMYQKTGRFIPINDTGTTTSISGTVYAVTLGYDSSGVPDDILQLQRRIVARQPNSTTDLLSDLVAEFTANPVVVVHFAIIKILRAWFGTYSGKRENLVILLQLPYLFLIVWGLIRSRRMMSMNKYIIVNGITILYTWFMSTAVVTDVRYMAPMMALLIIFIPAIWAKSNRNLVSNDDFLEHPPAF